LSCGFYYSTILTKLFTKCNVQNGYDKEAYIEAGGIGFLALLGAPSELRVLNEKMV